MPEREQMEPLLTLFDIHLQLPSSLAGELPSFATVTGANGSQFEQQIMPQSGCLVDVPCTYGTSFRQDSWHGQH